MTKDNASSDTIVGTTHEYTYVVSLDAIARDGRTFHLATDDGARMKIAARVGVVALHNLDADLTIRASSKRLTIHGRMRAQLTRICVASLEEMDEHIDDDIDAQFRRGEDATDTCENNLDDGIHEGNELDLGEFLVQQLALAMAPYPRKDGAINLVEQYGATTETSPFHELAKLTGEIGKKHDT